MEPRILDYVTPRPVTFDWHPVLRFSALGPFTGACVGFAQTTAAALCWMWHGEPDFYFRGWSGVDEHFLLLTVGGGLVGIAYGLVLLIFERLSRRRVRLWAAIPGVVAIAFVVAAIIAEHEFRQQKIGFVFLPELIAVGIGLLVSVAAARRVP